MFIFCFSIGICEIFIFLIALLHSQSKCKKPQTLSELSLPRTISADISHVLDRDRTLEEEVSLHKILPGIKYFSELTGRADALYSELDLQVAYINNVVEIPLFFCLFAACLLLTNYPKCTESFSPWMRLLLIFFTAIITIGIIIMARVVTNHLSSSHYYDTIYAYLSETYRQISQNPLPENEYNFSHEDYCVTMLYTHYIISLQKHLKFNRTRLSKSIGAIIISILFLLYVYVALAPQLVPLT